MKNKLTYITNTIAKNNDNLDYVNNPYTFHINHLKSFYFSKILCDPQHYHKPELRTLKEHEIKSLYVALCIIREFL